MNYEIIKKELSAYNQTHVQVFIKYLKHLETETDKQGKIKNYWFAKNVTEQNAIELFNKVALDNLYIDGETITLGYKGKLLVTYNYQAYKNLVINAYPESAFDMQNVYKGDDFSFRKESGKVLYTHKINDPFSTKKEIIGTYCIIKNNRGEFLETLNMEEIAKMKKTATTTNVWDTWESEMILKSVIKRACKRHFKDIVRNVEAIDNENYDLELAELNEKDMEVREKIIKAKTREELGVIYNTNKNSFSNSVKLLELCQARIKEIEEEKNAEKKENLENK